MVVNLPDSIIFLCSVIGAPVQMIYRLDPIWSRISSSSLSYIAAVYGQELLRSFWLSSTSDSWHSRDPVWVKGPPIFASPAQSHVIVCVQEAGCVLWNSTEHDVEFLTKRPEVNRRVLIWEARLLEKVVRFRSWTADVPGCCRQVSSAEDRSKRFSLECNNLQEYILLSKSKWS
jgi:hypothetical protein